MTTSRRRPERKTGNLPVTPARRVPEKLQRMLWGLTAGRCEFAGCNKDLFLHSTTLLEGNFAEVAHIVAFREDGPRGKSAARPGQIHDIGNLMLLCKECHALIDDRPDEFSRELLQSYKRDHEERIRHVTNFGPEFRTTILQLKARIAGQKVDIPLSDIYQAISPRWPADRQGWIIDLSDIDIEEPAGIQVAKQKIDHELHRLYARGGHAGDTTHLSVFALAPIPILAYLGSRLSNKISTDFFQRHRDKTASPWQWRLSEQPTQYCKKILRKGSNRDKVAVIFSLSGSIQLSALPGSIDDAYWVYEITLNGSAPGVDFLRLREDLDNFRAFYRTFLGSLSQQHGQLEELLVFPAVPAPVAIALGFDLLPKVHPSLRIYDFRKHLGGFQEGLTVN